MKLHIQYMYCTGFFVHIFVLFYERIIHNFYTVAWNFKTWNRKNKPKTLYIIVCNNKISSTFNMFKIHFEYSVVWWAGETDLLKILIRYPVAIKVTRYLLYENYNYNKLYLIIFTAKMLNNIFLASKQFSFNKQENQTQTFLALHVTKYNWFAVDWLTIIWSNLKLIEAVRVSNIQACSQPGLKMSAALTNKIKSTYFSSVNKLDRAKQQ